jgi:hypothetical protein
MGAATTSQWRGSEQGGLEQPGRAGPGGSHDVIQVQQAGLEEVYHSKSLERAAQN